MHMKSESASEAAVNGSRAESVSVIVLSPASSYNTEMIECPQTSAGSADFILHE